MGKVMLVIDNPKSCSECPCISLGCCNAVGGVGFCKTIGDIYDKPNWCTLREVPQKQSLNGTLSEFQMGVRSGYNLCIDEIMNIHQN